MRIQEKRCFVTTDGIEFNTRNEAIEHQNEIDDATDNAVNRYLNDPITTKYDLEEIGIWEVRGEDPNPDIGGRHYEPLIGYFSGKFITVLRHATQQKNWGTWKGHGSIKKLNIKELE